ALIDHQALAANYRTLQAATTAEVIPIVKADAYGHGLDAVAATLEAAGAPLVGIAQVDEALAHLRRRAHGPHIFSWLYGPDQHDDLVAAIRANMHLAVAAPWQIDAVVAAARAAGRSAQIHLKVETGMGRAGIPLAEFPAVATRVADQSELHVIGLYSHLACADSDREVTTAQRMRFDEAIAIAKHFDFALSYIHLAASAGTLWHSETHYTHVRPGIALYGIAPDDTDAHRLNLQPVMRLEATLTSVKSLGAGTPISYGHSAVVKTDTQVGIVPLGYADGIDRAASNRGYVTHQASGRQCPILGRICMDQFMIDLGAQTTARAGDRIVVWGDGGPSVSQWATWVGTIGYEITTRLGVRVPRVHQGSSDG
ncbi:MAG: alanine racemase, partial [Bowdeniella nasicola]|nr:alanine racemase [Bowdeniella nasicola]